MLTPSWAGNTTGQRRTEPRRLALESQNRYLRSKKRDIASWRILARFSGIGLKTLSILTIWQILSKIIFIAISYYFIDTYNYFAK